MPSQNKQRANANGGVKQRSLNLDDERFGKLTAYAQELGVTNSAAASRMIDEFLGETPARVVAEVRKAAEPLQRKSRRNIVLPDERVADFTDPHHPRRARGGPEEDFNLDR
jgi:hypothetical protein